MEFVQVTEMFAVASSATARIPEDPNERLLAETGQLAVMVSDTPNELVDVAASTVADCNTNAATSPSREARGAERTKIAMTVAQQVDDKQRPNIMHCRSHTGHSSWLALRDPTTPNKANTS